MRSDKKVCRLRQMASCMMPHVSCMMEEGGRRIGRCSRKHRMPADAFVHVSIQFALSKDSLSHSLSFKRWYMDVLHSRSYIWKSKASLSAYIYIMTWSRSSWAQTQTCTTLAHGSSQAQAQTYITTTATSAATPSSSQVYTPRTHVCLRAQNFEL